jgi:hypothetical protein
MDDASAVLAVTQTLHQGQSAIRLVVRDAARAGLLRA